MTHGGLPRPRRSAPGAAQLWAARACLRAARRAALLWPCSVTTMSTAPAHRPANDSGAHTAEGARPSPALALARREGGRPGGTADGRACFCLDGGPAARPALRNAPESRCTRTVLASLSLPPSPSARHGRGSQPASGGEGDANPAVRRDTPHVHVLPRRQDRPQRRGRRPHAGGPGPRPTRGARRMRGSRRRARMRCRRCRGSG